MDLAEVVEDLICTFDGPADHTMDTLAMFVFAWILLALALLCLGRFVYDRVQASRSSSASKAKLIETPAKTTDAVSAISSAALAAGAPGVRKIAATGAPPVSSSSSKGGYVPPTPPTRKRLVRQSPAPEAGRKSKYTPAPRCTGPDPEVVQWVNEVVQWLYNDFVIANELLSIWIASLNEYTKKSVTEQGIGVELVRILPETHPPNLTNIFAEADSKDDVTITMDCDSTPAFQLKSFRQKADKVDTAHYRVDVNRFRARLHFYVIPEKMLFEVRCDGWPEIKIALAPVGTIRNNLDEAQLQEVIIEILMNALRATEVTLHLGQYPSCPRFQRQVLTPEQILPVHYDSMSRAYTSTPNHTLSHSEHIPGEKRLLVKVIRANQLGLSEGCQEPYCVVEMDEPPQKHQTAVQKHTNSPYWDEHFLFDVSPNTAELLFEIYDHAVKPYKFLGLGIVGVDELLVNPSQRQTITLQSRPYESDAVSGTLTVEFLFIEGADIPNIGSTQPYKIKESIRTPSPSRVKLTTSTNSYHTDGLSNGNHMQELTSKDLDRSRPFSNMNKNSLVIHSVQRQPSQRIVKVELSNGNWKEIERVELNLDQKDGEEVATNDETSEVDIINGEAKNLKGTSKTNEDMPPKDNSKPGDFMTDSATILQQHQQTTDIEVRGRPRKRRDFFGTIKRRLGKSKNRSKSAGPENDVGRDDSMNRSVSADRSRNDESYRLNVPGQRSIDETSRRSSLSEASGMSSASTRTYINEASTLVLETIENGVKRHYLVPLSIAQKSKWRKKGTKLHIYNDHTFVAKHLQGGTACQVCQKSIARRFGKQGYECRDCQIKCHKHCHVKVNDSCPTSTIHSVEL
ncbi:unnamed protein product [Acanthoscelides obtectus]|uniref:Uncharacterized protein n=2 Tax=Acanthoscelides obtectus TaxID=200917 RepID=A0A9P0KKJ5_ACAOB|nr:unnamed protein product [Acanthoscelides obtectus]CAK1623670.1 C2 domain-containing protein 2 [Acanthoscelides obtectus]